MKDKKQQIWDKIILHYKGIVPLYEFKSFKNLLINFECFDEFLENLQRDAFLLKPTRVSWVNLLNKINLDDTPSNQIIWKYIHEINYCRIIFLYDEDSMKLYEHNQIRFMITKINNEKIYRFKRMTENAYTMYRIRRTHLSYTDTYNPKYEMIERTNESINNLLDEWIKK